MTGDETDDRPQWQAPRLTRLSTATEAAGKTMVRNFEGTTTTAGGKFLYMAPS